MNGSGPAGLPEVIASLQALVAAKEAEVNEAKVAFEQVTAELRRLNAMLKAAQPPERKGTHGGARPGARTRYGQEELAIVVAQLREQGRPSAVEDLPGSFTVATVEELGVSKSRAARIVNYLRDTEQARLVGERRIGKGTRPSNVYLLADDE